ncbi:MAG: 3-dehydroquinate dehydratase [Paludibacteraceae bacterium]|nr:3-dehydroquinate dehydratase [Paludibacteraceae bacterium]
MRIAILNGPNLNLLGRREPTIYGTRSMEQVLLDIQRAYPDVYLEYHQSNHEGVLIDWVQELGVLGQRQELDGIVLNAGGYTHTSVALRDAVACSQVPVVEVHVSDITAREDFRRVSLMSDVCAHTIMGHGVDGYLEGVEWIIKQTSGNK